MQIDGVIIFEAASGKPLFSRVEKNIDSTLFSGFMAAIRKFSTHFSLGGLSSFTTEEKTVLLVAKEHIVTAMITSGILDYKKYYSIAYEISKKFESTFDISTGVSTNLNVYSGFTSQLNRILSKVPTLTEEKEVFKGEQEHEVSIQPDSHEKVIYMYTVNQQEELVTITPDNQTDLSSYPMLVIVNTIIKKIYILENTDDRSSKLLHLTNRAATKINKEQWNNEFQIHHISDSLACSNLIEQAVTLTEECDLEIVVDKPDKVILIGLAESGKTTIVKVIGEGYVPDKEASYQATLDYKRKNLSLLGEKLTIFDLGGQKTFLDRFTGELAKFIFNKVKATIFVVDSVNVSRLSLAKYYLELTANNLERYSPTSPLYVLLHKMDLVDEKKKEELSSNMKIFLEAGSQQPLTFFETTVFDETIFNAFGTIFTNIMRTQEPLEKIIDNFINENSSIVKMVQLFSETGVPLIDTSRSPHIFFNGTKTSLDEIIENLTNRKGLASSAFIESENDINVIRFLANGAVLFLNFSRVSMQEKGESIPSVYNKVIILTEKLDSLNSQI